MKPNIKSKVVFLIIASAILFYSTANPANSYEAEAIKAYNQAIDYSSKKDYKSAITYFKKAALLDPNFSDAYFNLGAIYEYMNETDNAIEAFNSVFKNNPSDYEAIYKMALLYDSKEEYKRALDCLSLIPVNYPKYTQIREFQKKVQLKYDAEKANSFKKVSSDNPYKTILKDFQGPTGIAKDKENNIYIANYSTNSIVQIAPDGKRKTIISGNPINGPVGMAIDGSNNIYVANYTSNEILKITPQNTVSVILKAVKRPYYLFIDGNNLYISEQGTNTVIKLKI